MSFANTLVGNTYRPDRRILDALTALSARVEEEKTAIQARASASEAKSTELTALVLAIHLWALTLTDGDQPDQGGL